MNEMEFTDKFVETLKRMADVEIVEIKALQINYRRPGDSNTKMFFLNNAYNKYKNGEAAEDVFERYAKASLAVENDSFSMTDIVPVIKDDAYLDEVSAAIRQKYKEDTVLPLAYMPYCEGLNIFFAVDTPENMRYLHNDEVEKLNMSHEELLQLAVQNLGNKLSQIQLHGDDGTYMLTAGGDYEASLILLDIWDQIAPNVDGELVIAVPARDIVLITGANNTEGLEIISEKAADIVANGDYTLGTDLFQRQNSTWVNRTRRLQN